MLYILKLITLRLIQAKTCIHEKLQHTDTRTKFNPQFTVDFVRL